MSLMFKSYIDGGKSLFLPFVPDLDFNLLIQIPDFLPPIKFTMGHLFDIIIIINLYFYLETSVYHYYKRAYMKEDDLIYIGALHPKETDLLSIFNESYRETEDFLEDLQVDYFEIKSNYDFRDEGGKKNISNNKYPIKEKIKTRSYCILISIHAHGLLNCDKTQIFIILFLARPFDSYPFPIFQHSSFLYQKISFLSKIELFAKFQNY